MLPPPWRAGGDAGEVHADEDERDSGEVVEPDVLLVAAGLAAALRLRVSLHGEYAGHGNDLGPESSVWIYPAPAERGTAA